MVGTLCKLPAVVVCLISLLNFRLKIRDQQTSAALGLPPRIHDEDCNVPSLVPSDLEETRSAPNTSIFREQQEHHKLYIIEMVQLAKICMLSRNPDLKLNPFWPKIVRSIISIVYSPTRSPQMDNMIERVQRSLTIWESGLAPPLRLENATTKDSLFLVGMLHMTYK